MKIIDPGHRYETIRLDGPGVEVLQFVKRLGANYPGNCGPAVAGTTLQEVLRVLIDRCRYVNAQIPCLETTLAINNLLAALALFEIRAKRVKGKFMSADINQIEAGPICPHCGHVECTETHSIAVPI